MVGHVPAVLVAADALAANARKVARVLQVHGAATSAGIDVPVAGAALIQVSGAAHAVIPIADRLAGTAVAETLEATMDGALAVTVAVRAAVTRNDAAAALVVSTVVEVPVVTAVQAVTGQQAEAVLTVGVAPRTEAATGIRCAAMIAATSATTVRAGAIVPVNAHMSKRPRFPTTFISVSSTRKCDSACAPSAKTTPRTWASTW